MNIRRKSRISPATTAQEAVIGSLKDVRVLNVALLTAALLLLVGYLAMTTRTGTKGFALKGIEQRIAELRDEARRADVAMAEGRSMDSLSAQVGSLGLVPVTEMQYVNAGGAVAVR